MRGRTKDLLEGAEARGNHGTVGMRHAVELIFKSSFCAFPMCQASRSELQSLAEVLHVRVSDLLVSPLEEEEEVGHTDVA